MLPSITSWNMCLVYARNLKKKMIIIKIKKKSLLKGKEIKDR